jgi:uncharacterized repeat protein (TIGR03803 family)
LAAQFTTLLSFNGANGWHPEAEVTVDSNGNLFGTTLQGGAGYYGTVFEIKNTGTAAAPVYASAPTTLVTFSPSGFYPKAGLIADAKGDLFGTTSAGGSGGNGTLFEIQNTGTVAVPIYASGPTTLVSFGSNGSNGSNGELPNGRLIADSNGNLFGTTETAIGADGYGTAFEIKNTGTVSAPVYTGGATTLVTFGFSGSSGIYPEGGLVADANGDLFGTTSGGGANGDGAVFEIQNIGTVSAPVYASAPITLVTFNGSNGAEPYAGLTVDSNGNLFGTTLKGGASGTGTVFEIQNTGTVAAPVYASNPITLLYGGSPEARLIVDANGDLFGTTDSSVFEIKNTGTVAVPVYSTPTTLGGGLSGLTVAGLTVDANGNLFGTTSGDGGPRGYGTVFEITGAGFTLTPPPTISGTIGGQTTTSETPVKPFAHVTIGDANVGATDTLTITLGGGGGTLKGTGLSGGTGGVYTLSGTAAAITNELDALVFTPTAGLSNTSLSTTFTLTDQSSAGGTAAVDTTTTVINKDLLYPGTTVRAYNGYSLNMLAINLTKEASYGIGRSIDPNVSINDTTYASTYSVETYIGGNYYEDVFAGQFSTDSSKVVTGGTVSAYFEFTWNGSAWVLGNSTTGFSYSAVDFYNAGISGAPSDTARIEVSIHSGNDVISGSTGNDILFGEGGNDVINGGGGVDTAEYAGKRSDYSIFRNTDGSTSVVDRNPNVGDGTDTLYNITYLDFTDQKVAVDSLAPPPPVVHPNKRSVEPNNLALSGSVTGAHNFIDTLNFVASYGDLINAFGTNQQAAQNWYNKQEPIEQRVETFDGLDYVASYGDLINAFKSAGSKQAALDSGATHFINSGYHEGRTTTFNGLDYIASYGDLINALGANGDAGAYHYIESGASEGRKTTFDGLDYIASYGDLINALGANEQAGAAHFINSGYHEGRTTTFNGLDYIASYGDLMQAFGDNNDAGASHYIQAGHNEGRTTSFDGLDYIASYGDLIKALGDNEQAGAEHFIESGHKEGRTTTFDGLAYIANNTDLMNAFGADNDAGAKHYIDAGFSEHRSTSFNVGAYESAHPDLIGKFSSNDAFLTAYINTYKATGTFLA